MLHVFARATSNADGLEDHLTSVACHPAPLTLFKMTKQSRNEIDSRLMRKSRAVMRNSHRRFAATDSHGFTRIRNLIVELIFF